MGNRAEYPTAKRHSAEVFYLPRYGYPLPTRTLRKWNAELPGGRKIVCGRLPPRPGISTELRYARFFNAPLRTCGPNAEIDIATRTYANFDTASALIEGAPEVAEKADFALCISTKILNARHISMANSRPSWSGILKIGNPRNRRKTEAWRRLK